MGGGSLPSFLSPDGDQLVIDQNSRELDSLKAGETLDLTVTYTITDGELTTTNEVTLTITGAKDKYQATDSFDFMRDGSAR